MKLPSRPAAGLLLAIAVYVVLRALILVSNFDGTAMPAYELYMIGTLSRQLLGGGGGMPLPLYYDNAAGQLALSYLGAGVFAICGTSYLALKLVAGLLNLGALVFLWKLLKRLFGGLAANVGALLFAVAPATLLKYTIFTGGNHAENLFFTVGALLVFFAMHQDGVTPRRLLWSGFTIGFAVFIFLGAITPVGILVLTHLGLRGWRDTLNDARWCLPGLALGLAPLVGLNLALGSRGLSFLGAKFGGGAPFDWSVFAARFAEFFTVHLPASTTYGDFLGVSGSAADAGFLLAYGICVVLVLPAALRSVAALARGACGAGDRRERSLEQALYAGLLGYLLLTGVAYALSDLRIGDHPPPMESAGYRYFLPQLTFAIVLLASQVGRPGARAWSGAPAILVLALGAFDLSLVDWTFAHPNAGAHYDGYNIKQNARALLNKKNELTDEQIVAYAEAFTPLFRSRVYYGLGFYSAFTAAGELDLTALCARFPAARRGDVARGVGTFLRHRTAEPGVLLPERAGLIASWLATDVPHAEAAVEGLCSRWSVQLSNDVPTLLDEDERLLATSPESLRPGLARGFGVECGRLLRRGLSWEIDDVAGRLERIPAALRPTFAAGVGAGLADGGEQPALGERAAVVVRELGRPEVLAGARARLAEIWDDERPDLLVDVEASLAARP